MKMLVNEELSKYTTVRIGGVAQEMYIPESVEELLDIVKKNKLDYFLGGEVIY